MKEIAVRCRAEVHVLGGEWGVPISDEVVAKALAAHPDAKAVCVVHAETSTGLLQPLEGIGRLCGEHGALFLVDAVASLGGIPLEVDAWGIDVCYSGSQKCLSVPPGLAPITYSPKALAARVEPDPAQGRQTSPATYLARERTEQIVERHLTWPGRNREDAAVRRKSHLGKPLRSG